MSMESDLIAWLVGAPGVAAICNGSVHWSEIAQGDTLPAVVIHLVADGIGHAHGPVRASGPARVQIDCVAATQLGAIDLAAAVRAVMDAGTDGARIKRAFAVSGARDASSTVAGETRFGRSNDYEIHHKEL